MFRNKVFTNTLFSAATTAVRKFSTDAKEVTQPTIAQKVYNILAATIYSDDKHVKSVAHQLIKKAHLDPNSIGSLSNPFQTPKVEINHLSTEALMKTNVSLEDIKGLLDDEKKLLPEAVEAIKNSVKFDSDNRFTLEKNPEEQLYSYRHPGKI